MLLRKGSSTRVSFKIKGFSKKSSLYNEGMKMCYRVNLEIECLKFAFAFALFLFDKIHIVTTFETAVLH